MTDSQQGEDYEQGESGEGRANISSTAIASSYKVLGEFTDANGAGVLGQNNAASGTPIGVEGAVPNAGSGYGLYTADDAKVVGTMATDTAWQVHIDDELGLGIDAPGTFSTGSTQYETGGNLSVGHLNTIGDGAVGSTIGGGGLYDATNDDPFPNTITDHLGTIGGGYGNQAGDGDGDPLSALSATVGGGSNNIANESNATVGGGTGNTSSGIRATISGGRNNEASANGAAVGGGSSNTASSSFATVGGGVNNTASVNRATVAGGRNNGATALHAAVGGGTGNQASAESATVPGGHNNSASGQYSFATGREAKASHDGAILFGDSTSNQLQSQAADEVRFQGDVAAEGSRSVGELGMSVGFQEITVPPNTETQLQFTVPSFETKGDVDQTNHKYIIDEEGFYLVNLSVAFSGMSTGDQFESWVVGGGFIILSNGVEHRHTATTANGSKVRKLNAGDELKAYVEHDGASDRTIRGVSDVSYFQVVHLG